MKRVFQFVVAILIVIFLLTAFDIARANAVTGGGWSVQKHFTDEYLATHNGYLMACRSGWVNIHKWGPSPIGDEFNYKVWNTACFRGPASNHRLWFSYFHYTPTGQPCNAICSLDSLTFNGSNLGCWGGIYCQMVGRYQEGKFSVNLDLIGYHNQFFPSVKFNWAIVPWAPNRGQIGVTTYPNCGGC